MPDLFLLHFEPRYEHAGHYLGYSKGNGRGRKYASALAQRVGLPPHGLLRSVFYADIDIKVARVFQGEGRDEQLRMRANGSLSRFCPICRARDEYHR